MTHQKFAKLYETEEYGQILVQKDINSDDNDSVKVTIMHEDGFFISLHFGYEDENERDDKFDMFDKELAMKVASGFPTI